mgnify:CR=1 FL=1
MKSLATNPVMLFMSMILMIMEDKLDEIIMCKKELNI